MIYIIVGLNILGMLSILIKKTERSLRLVGVLCLRLGERYHKSSILNRQYSIPACPGRFKAAPFQAVLLDLWMIVKYLPYYPEQILELIGFFNKYGMTTIMGFFKICA